MWFKVHHLNVMLGQFQFGNKTGAKQVQQRVQWTGHEYFVITCQNLQ